MPESLSGIGVSAGVAAGPLLRIGAAPALPPPVPVTDVAAEVARAYAAIDEVVADLERRADRAAEATVAEVLRAEAMMAGDDELRDAVREHVEGGTDGPHAIDAAFGTFRAMFAEAGG